MKKGFAMLLCVLLLALGAFAGCAKESKTLKLTVSEVTHSVFYAPQYVAMEKGFFAEEGLEIELVNGGGADKVMTAVLSNQVQIGLAGPEACIYVMKEGRESYPQVFAQLTKRDGSFLVGREKIDFKWEDLKGSYVIGGRAGGVPLMTLEYLLREKGIVPNVDCTVDSSVQFNMMVGAFTGGLGDYVTVFEPTATMMEEAGQGVILASIGEESGEIPFTAYFASGAYIEKNPDVVQRFTNAIAKGQRWVAEHTAKEIAEAMLPYFPDTDVSVLEKVVQRYKDIDAWNTTPVMKQEAFEKLERVMIEAGVLEEPVDFSSVVNMSFAKKVK